MSDLLQSSIRELQAGGLPAAQQAFGRLMSMALRDPQDLAAALSRAVRDEYGAGELRTSRLLTLLGLTRIPAPECLGVCLRVLRELGTADDRPPFDAVLGAAAIVARCAVARLGGDCGEPGGVARRRPRYRHCDSSAAVSFELSAA